MERYLYVAVWAVFGAVFGSFANVVIWRFPRGQSIAAPPSSCPSCGHPIRGLDNVPVVSWLMLRARCRDCGARISARYPLVEGLSAVLFACAAAFFPEPGRALSAAVFFWMLLVLSLIDLDTMRLPNLMVGGLAMAGAVGALVAQLAGVAAVPLTPMVSGFLAQPLAGAVAGAVLGAGMSGAIAAAYAGVRKREGFGMGDVKLLGTMGLFLGPYVLVAFFAGSLLGVAGRLVGAAAGGRGLAERAPFGPYLAAGGVIAALAGPGIVGWYLAVLGLA